MSPPENLPPDEVITCRVTRWFFQRMGILAAMLVGMGLYFCYDGKFGYRNENKIVDKKDWFEGEFLKSYDVAKKGGTLDEWMTKARGDGLPTGENGEPPRWPTYAAQFGWPEKAKRHSEEEIAQQFWWGGAMLAIALLVGLKVLLDFNKKLVGHADCMIMPGGAEVPFADVFKVDKRKWNNKALAYVFYRSADSERRAVVDDLKYGGANKVLDRLIANFKGELIEKAPDEDETPEHPVAKSPK